MARIKHVAGVGDLPFTEAQEAQADLDEAKGQAAAAARATVLARADAYLADSDRTDLMARLLTASVADVENYIDNNITLSGTTVAQLRNEVQTVLRVVVKRIVKAMVLNVVR